MDNDKLLGCFGLVILAIALEIAGGLLNGWALSILWGWFFVPLGLSPIRILHAIGVGVTVSLLTSRAPRCNDERTSNQKFSESAAHMFVTPLVALAMGWIVLQFM